MTTAVETEVPSVATVAPASSLLTLRPPPAPDPAVLAAIAAAVQMAWPRPAPADEYNPVHETWRFSGRWWNKPVPLSRNRPWARR